MSRINEILNLLSEKESDRKFPSSSRFDEIKEYFDLIQDVSKKINPNVLSNEDGQNLIKRLIDIMFQIEYLQSDFMRLKNK